MKTKVFNKRLKNTSRSMTKNVVEIKRYQFDGGVDLWRRELSSIINIILLLPPHEKCPYAKILDNKIEWKKFNKNLIHMTKFSNINEFLT